MKTDGMTFDQLAEKTGLKPHTCSYLYYRHRDLLNPPAPRTRRLKAV